MLKTRSMADMSQLETVEKCEVANIHTVELVPNILPSCCTAIIWIPECYNYKYQGEPKNVKRIYVCNISMRARREQKKMV